MSVIRPEPLEGSNGLITPMSKSPGCQRISPSIDIGIGIGLAINP